MAAYDLKVRGRKVTLQLNAQNILDKRFYTDIQEAGFPAAAPFSAVTALYGAPRTILGSVKVAL
jgi:outer membrane receptor for monomeric catechols